MTSVSVVLPAYRAVDQINRIVPEMIRAVEGIVDALEIILVVNGPRDGTDQAADALSERDPRVVVVRAEPAGWGRAVRVGLERGRGELLAYTNLARTTPEILRDTINVALVAPGYVVKANRIVRESIVRRGGSLLYNLECRMLFRIPVLDVNGTPKVFPAKYSELRTLARDDDLIDAEFMAICGSRGHSIAEVSVPMLPRHSGRSTTNVASAWHMYTRLFELRRDLRQRGMAAEAM